MYNFRVLIAFQVLLYLCTDGVSAWYEEREREEERRGRRGGGQPKANKNSEKELICKHTFRGKTIYDSIEMEAFNREEERLTGSQL